MSPVYVTALALGAAIVGALLTAFICRKLHRSEIARTTSEASVEARSREAGLVADLAASRRESADLAARLETTNRTVLQRDRELRESCNEITRLKTEEATFQTRLDELSRNQSQLKDAFQSLCGEALKSNNEQFLQLARTELERIRLTAKAELDEKETAIQSLLSPIREGLEKYDKKLHDIELARTQTFASLVERIDQVATASDVLRGETANLVKALRSSNVQGAWGELQLKRVVELAGMLEHCDFDTQRSVDANDGRLRPDMVIHMPGSRTIVVDAKTPANAVLEAVNCQDDARRRQLCNDHVVSVRKHIDALSRKAYWEQFDQAPDFVVMFLPSEAFFSMALEFDPALFESSFEQRVLITTPTTLVALLKAVAVAWRQEALAQNAQEISELGRDLYERIRVLGDHFDDIGSHLGKSVSAYNKAVSSLEKRVLPQARRFQALGTRGTKDIVELSPLEISPLPLSAAELRQPLPPA